LIEILPADNKRLFREFLLFPFRLYPEDSLWVPPLLKDIKEQYSSHNPFFKHAEVVPFIARVNGKTAGRITAIYNRTHIEFHKEQAGFFGFFDCVNEHTVAKALIAKVIQWHRQRGTEIMRGPMNFTSNEEWGLLVEGFEYPPSLMMPYNHPYYQKLLEDCGLYKAKDLLAYALEVPEQLPEKFYRVANLTRKQSITIRNIHMKSFREELDVFKKVYNSAWEENWGFVPMTDEEIDYMAKKLKSVIVPELVFIAEHNRCPIGFMMLLPDFNIVLKKLNGRLFPFGIIKALWFSKKIKELRLLLFGIVKGYRRRGVDALLLLEGLKTVKNMGYKKVEFSWILEDNYPVRRIIETANSRLYKRYRIYETKI
jgi:GNAT superfamily N-acetyltransferase